MTGSTISRYSDQSVVGQSSGRLLGIWRLVQRVHASQWTELYRAQPADATGSPRADYMVKAVVTGNPRHQLEGASHIRAEVSALANIRHPNLVAVLDYSLSGTMPYLVMPCLPGSSLQHWLSAEQWQPLPVSLWWVRQMAQGLVALHEGGWCHGDIKPANVMLSKTGHATLIDLGFARRIGSTRGEHQFCGSAHYAAPELIRGEKNVAAAADIYPLGVILWQMKNRQADAAAFLNESIKCLESEDPVDQLICQLTASDPATRPTAAQTVERLLRQEIESLGEHIRPSPTNHRRAA